MRLYFPKLAQMSETLTSLNSPSVNQLEIVSSQTFFIPGIQLSKRHKKLIFTHTSINKDATQNNRRLSFIGDATANLIIAFITSKTNKKGKNEVGTCKSRLQSNKNFKDWALLLKFPALARTASPISKTSRIHATIFEAYVGAFAATASYNNQSTAKLMEALINWFQKLINTTDNNNVNNSSNIFETGFSISSCRAKIVGHEAIRWVMTKTLYKKLPTDSVSDLEKKRAKLYKSTAFKELKKKGLKILQIKDKNKTLLATEVGRYLLESKDPNDFAKRMEALEKKLLLPLGL